MRLSLILQAVAAVAAPIRKECPLYNVESIPAHLRGSLVRYFPVSHMKSGPLLWGLRERYCNIAESRITFSKYDKECGVSNVSGAHTSASTEKKHCYFSFSATASGCFEN